MIEKKPVYLAIAWLVPAVGAAIFVTIQSFSFLNDYVRSGATLQAITFGPAALWVSPFFMVPGSFRQCWPFPEGVQPIGPCSSLVVSCPP